MFRISSSGEGPTLALIALLAACQKATSRDDLETRTAALARARAEVGADQAAVETARLNLEWTVVHAPIDGRVSSAAVTRGNYVQNGSATTPLTNIVSQDPIYVYFSV